MALKREYLFISWKGKWKLIPSRNFLFPKILFQVLKNLITKIREQIIIVKLIRVWEVSICWHGGRETFWFVATEETGFYCLESHLYSNRNIRERFVGLKKDSVARSFVKIILYSEMGNSLSYIEKAVVYASWRLHYGLYPLLGV